ncbi:hypothetical protein CMV_030770, partial [Castanea mollissima]
VAGFSFISPLCLFGVTEFVNPKDHDKPLHKVLAEMTNGGDDAFKTHPMNILNERTIKGTFFGNYQTTV